jgi:hypothetical protein
MHYADYTLDTGSIHASTVLYKSTLHLYISRLLDDRMCTELLETVLFANIRFHDTVSRGRLLNRFGKDFEGRSSSVTAAAYISRRRRYRQQPFR